jgi:AmmeMemoRadiSam system protein A
MPGEMTTETDRQLLLQLARDAIVAHVCGRTLPAPPLVGPLAINRGAFVTLHAHGALRGCIGHIEADEPIGRVVPRCAVSACSADARFAAVTADELPALAIELSLLGPLLPVGEIAEIEVGRDGLIVEDGGRRGLLLPQVATEWKWDRETFLAQTCQKAGLAPGAWRKGARLWRFEAEVFGDRE